MSLLDVLRAGIQTVDKVTKPLQATVQHDMFTGDAGVGAEAYSRVARVAIVDKKQRQVRTTEGVLTMSSAMVMFLDPSIVVTTFDRVFLPDSTGGPILALSGFVDKGTGKVMYTEIYLG